MKIMSLEIENIRGIKTIKIEPRGENAVIFGPNGAGKSALVDALDFLFTGSISRLTGEGSKFLRLKEHGCHVDSRKELESTRVIARVEIDGKEVVLERSIGRPRSLKVEPEKDKGLVKEHLGIAELGLHILSRRDILRYVTSEAGQRAKAIMSLLNLENIETIRSNLVTVRNETSDDFKDADSSLEQTKSEISHILSLRIFSEEASLEKVNSLRELLNGQKIGKLTPENIREGIEPRPFGAMSSILSTPQIGNTIAELRYLIQTKDIANKVQELEDLVKEVSKEADIERCRAFQRLINAGLSLVDEKNICPLCGRKWKNGSLESFLKERQQEMEIEGLKYRTMDEASTYIKTKVDLLKNDIEVLLKAHKQFKIEVVDEEKAQNHIAKLSSWSAAMSEPLKSFHEGKWSTSDMKGLLSTPLIETKILCPLDNILAEVSQKFPEQEAWDTLTKMEDRWKTYQKILETRKASEKVKKRAQASLEYFEKARDSILDDVYTAVRSHFEEYYRVLHSEDESSFCSKISPKKAELIFEVDFYGRGMFPPHAMHSEGHQDSMGLCLFFALNNYLVKDALNTIILDDVVMSIDRSHRRAICSLLKKAFPNKQLMISTHDADWAQQLKTEGLVSKKNMIHFLHWNIETGPKLEMDKDFWDKIEEDLKNDNVPSAAFNLRRNAECFFDDVCDLLRATSLPYTATHQWTLGEFATAAISTYKGYLKRAKTNSEKLSQKDETKALQELEEKANKLVARSQIEQWAINENVHFNRWKEFTKEDFQPVVEAFKDLFDLFICSSCESMISRMENVGSKPKSIVTCNCGQVHWNIE